MTITLDPDHEQMIRKALNTGAYQSPDEVVGRALEILSSQDGWLQQNRGAIDAKIRRGIEELDRGEGIPEDKLDAYLAKLKSQAE